MTSSVCSSFSASLSKSVICALMLLIALLSASYRLKFSSLFTQTVYLLSCPNILVSYCIVPSIISGCSAKYELTAMPSPVTPRCTQSGSISIFRSLFCKKRMSAVTSVPALSLNAVFGSRIAPTSSALSARYFRIVGLLLSSVPFVVITATIPPGLA